MTNSESGNNALERKRDASILDSCLSCHTLNFSWASHPSSCGTRSAQNILNHVLNRSPADYQRGLHAALPHVVSMIPA
eukprot:1156965-Pelagomonas_calceolata.AAC.2